MNTEPIVIITQAPFSTFDQMVIGIVLLIVMAILGARWLTRRLWERRPIPVETEENEPRDLH